MTDWSEVYRTTYEDLVRFLYRKVWDPDRARDLAQETFVRVLDHGGDEVRSPRAFVFAVAANLARDEARTVIRRKKHLALLKNESDPADPAPAPDEAAIRKEQSEAARRALEQLSDRDREVLLLWDGGLSYPEIAAQTGLAIGAIGTTLSRARKRLIAAYESREEDHVARG